MKITIETIDNGWLLTENHQEMGTTTNGYVGSTDSEELRAFADLLWEINNVLGPTTHKRSKERISISLEPGDDYEEI